MKIDRFVVEPDKKIRLKDFSPSDTSPYGSKDEVDGKFRDDLESLTELQAKLAAANMHALLIVLQGIDASGKDGTIKHVMSGVNPAGCQVRSFKVPSTEELDHDYLWRYAKAMPERGNIGIFNRSHYEEVLVVRVHSELLLKQKIALPKNLDSLWTKRYREINEFERYLSDNGVSVLKFFLHISKKEQRKRFLERLDRPDKYWKFSASDVRERAFWDDYVRAFEDMLSHTSTSQAPWHVIPADNKWFARLVVADIVVRRLKSLKLSFPEVSGDELKALHEARKMLEQESE